LPSAVVCYIGSKSTFLVSMSYGRGRVWLAREAIIFWPLTISQRMGSLCPCYLSDDLCTLITGSFNDLEVSRVGFGRQEKLAKLFDLVNLGGGEILPCVVLPAKEPCMQTTVCQ
jgi:hypothetical protein